MDIPHYIDHVCMYCRHYTFRVRDDAVGWAYCEQFGKHFPNQRNEENREDWKPVGERTCKKWETKRSVNHEL